MAVAGAMTGGTVWLEAESRVAPIGVRGMSGGTVWIWRSDRLAGGRIPGGTVWRPRRGKTAGGTDSALDK